MEHLPPRANMLLTDEYRDITGDLSDFTLRMKIDTELHNAERLALDGANDKEIYGRLNTALFGEGKFPRRAGIMGPALNSDMIFATEPLEGAIENRELDRLEGILHGFSFVTVVEKNREVRLPALHCESLIDEQHYYFPFHMIESLEYARDAIPVQAIVRTFEEEASVIHGLRQNMAMDDVSDQARLAVFRLEQQRINNLLMEVIDRGETFEFTPDFYYFFEEGEAANLLFDNSATLGLDQLLATTELKGKFIGFSMPLLMQPDVMAMEVFFGQAVDPYEPCVMFYNEDTARTYAVPYTSLHKLS